MKLPYLSVLLAGFVSGIGIGSFVDFGWALPVFLLVLGLAVLFSTGEYARRGAILSVSLFLFASALGLARMELENYHYQNNLADLAEQKASLRGIVSEYPDVRETNSRFIVEEDKTGENFLVISDIYPAVHYGDKLELSGVIRPVKSFSADGVNFDYKKYLGKDGVFNEMLYPKISVVSSGNGNWLVSKLFFMREKFSGKLRGNISEPEASLGLGMLIGEKHALPESLLDTFKKAGVIHLVVLSGYNIALVSQFFTKIFSFLPILYRTGIGGIAIILFVLMTGGGASAIRAAVMALIALLGIATGRTYDAGRALFVAGFLMLLQNPNILIYDPSFELSFLATTGLIYLTPVIFSKIGKWRPAWFRELFSQTLATQISVLPLLIYLSGSVSLVSLPTNLLIIPTVPVAMMGSFATGILGFIGHVIALPVALLTSLLLSYTILTAKFFASLPFATFNAGGIVIAILLFSYALIYILKK